MFKSDLVLVAFLNIENNLKIKHFYQYLSLNCKNNIKLKTNLCEYIFKANTFDHWSVRMFPPKVLN